MIHDFDNGHLDAFFKGKGIRKRKVDSLFKTLKDIDFSKQLDLGKAVLDQTGAYVIDDSGERYPVYYYKKDFWFYWENEPKKNPKFHILKCETLKEHSGFRASNTKTARVENKSQKGDRFYEVEMELCWNCARMASTTYATTADFFKALEKKYEGKNEEQQNIKIDLNGYTLDWVQISKNYRKAKGYKCEKCNIHLSIDRKFLHVHHKNHKKTDNRDQNLESLCVLCHKHEDELHKRNFASGKMKRLLEEFIKKFCKELKDLNNPYI